MKKRLHRGVREALVTKYIAAVNGGARKEAERLFGTMNAIEYLAALMLISDGGGKRLPPWVRRG